MMQPESEFEFNLEDAAPLDEFEDDFEDEDVEITEPGPNPYDGAEFPEEDIKP